MAISIMVNGEPYEVEPDKSLKEVVERVLPGGGASLGACAGFAVAHNLEVVPLTRLGERVVRAGDRIEVIRAVGGG